MVGPHTAGTERNACEVLMASAREIILPPPLSALDGRQIRSDQRLYNDLLGKSEGTGNNFHWQGCRKIY